MADKLVLIIFFLVKFLIFYFMPGINGRDTLFGLVLEKNELKYKGAAIVKKYRTCLVLVAVLFLSGLVFVFNENSQSLAITYTIASLADAVLLLFYFRKTWLLSDNKPLTRFAVSLKIRRLRDFTHAWLEIGVALVVIAPFAILVYYYPQLPEIVPIHWNASGEPDAWQKKDFMAVFVPPLLALFLHLILLLLKNDMVNTRFRVPLENAENIALLKELSLQNNIGLLDWCRLFVGFLFTLIGLLILTSIESFPFSNEITLLIWSGLIIFLAGTGFYVYQMILVNREIKRLAGQINFQTETERESWNSGVFYYNKEDGAFLLEKPTGLGYTFNFANKRVWVYVLLILPPLVLLAADFVLTEKV